MKKVFGQTVRDIKREVNKKVLKIPGIEQKILDATNNEPWGPHGTLLVDIAHATQTYHEYQIIMAVIWKRVNDTGKNWRHVYKALSVLEYLAAHGSERVIDEIREHSHQISTLSDFQYIDSSGKDQGSNVRRKSQSLVSLVNDKDRIQEVRQKAHTNREKCCNMYTTGGMHQAGRGYGDGGQCGSRNDNRNLHGKERNARDIDGCGGHLNNQGGERYCMNTDDHGDIDGHRNFEDNRKKGNDLRGQPVLGVRDHSPNEDCQHSPGQLACEPSGKNLGAPPSYEEAMGEHQNHVSEERDRIQSPPPKETSPPSPNTSTEIVDHGETKVELSPALSQINEQGDASDEFDPRGAATAAAPGGNSFEADIFGLLLDPVGSLDAVPIATIPTPGSGIPNLETETNFSTVPSATNVFNQIADDPFRDSPFSLISHDNSSLVQQPNLSPGTSFQLQTGLMNGLEAPLPLAQEMHSTESFNFGDSFHGTTDATKDHVSSTLSEVLPHGFAVSAQDGVAPAPLNPFVIESFMTPELTRDNALSQPASSASEAYATTSASQAQAGVLAAMSPQTCPYSPSQWGSALPPPVSCSFPSNDLSHQGEQALVATQGNPPNDPLSELGFPVSVSSQIVPSMPSQSGLSTPLDPQAVSLSALSQSGLPSFGVSQPTVPFTSGDAAKLKQEKFETKSTVWADTLSRGLIDLNISGPKTNPLADIGVDFDSINRKEKRKEKDRSSTPPVSTITMGKAMGSGSGMGLAGASSLAPPPNPMMNTGTGMGMHMPGNSGMNMGMAMAMVGGYGAGMNQQMGMIGAGMGMGMGMGMVMGQGAPMQPVNGMGMPSGPAMSGFGYNPMMGMGGPGGYGSQQQQYGSHR